MVLRERVKYLRERLRMNQSQLAQAAGMTQATISRLESGKVQSLHNDSLRRLADALGSTVDYLLGAGDELSPHELVRCDRNARAIIQNYSDLSTDGRHQLRMFSSFLLKEEEE